MRRKFTRKKNKAKYKNTGTSVLIHPQNIEKQYH